MASNAKLIRNIFLAYYNTEFRESKSRIQTQIVTLEKDPDRDVRDNVFSPFSEKEKTESPSSDDMSEDIRSEIEASLPPPVAEVVTPQVEIVETPPPPAEDDDSLAEDEGIAEEW